VEHFGGFSFFVNMVKIIVLLVLFLYFGEVVDALKLKLNAQENVLRESGIVVFEAALLLTLGEKLLVLGVEILEGLGVSNRLR